MSDSFRALAIITLVPLAFICLATAWKLFKVWRQDVRLNDEHNTRSL